MQAYDLAYNNDRRRLNRFTLDDISDCSQRFDIYPLFAGRTLLHQRNRRLGRQTVRNTGIDRLLTIEEIQ